MLPPACELPGGTRAHQRTSRWWYWVVLLPGSVGWCCCLEVVLLPGRVAAWKCCWLLACCWLEVLLAGGVLAGVAAAGADKGSAGLGFLFVI